MVLPSKAFEIWNNEARLLIQGEKNKLSAADRNHLPIRTRCVVEVMMYAHDARKFDLTNKAESVMDLLVDAGIIEDDNCEIVGNLELAFGGIDRTNPRAEVQITY